VSKKPVRAIMTMCLALLSTPRGTTMSPCLLDIDIFALLASPAPAEIVPWRYAETLADVCAETGVPLPLAARMFAWESGWRASTRNVNPNGTEDLGIAQLNMRYLSDWERIAGGPIDPLDGHDSIRVGVRYLAELYKVTGDWSGAVAAYNCGLGRWRGGNIPASTRRHVAAVMGE
jgi:hypothetical protein